jgi:hypothetical protein
VEQLYELADKTVKDGEIIAKYYDGLLEEKDETKKMLVSLEAMEAEVVVLKRYLNESDKIWNGMTIEKKFQLKRSIDEVVNRAVELTKKNGTWSEELPMDEALISKSSDFTDREKKLIEIGVTERELRAVLPAIESEIQMAKSMIALGQMLGALGEAAGEDEGEKAPSEEKERF